MSSNERKLLISVFTAALLLGVQNVPRCWPKGVILSDKTVLFC